ncbi:unnamed protein product, partial [Brassica oleracea var. botrytis]
TKGFVSCLQELSCSLDAQTLSQLFLLGVYDGYKSRCPYFLDNVHGIEPSEVHFHIQSYRPNPDIKSRKGN